MKIIQGIVFFIAFLSSSAFCSDYPSRPIKIIQPLGIGTPADIFSRAIGQQLSEKFGQAVIVENKVGANGVIGMDACAKAPPDGYTICIPSFSQVSLNPVVYPNIPYEPLRDFSPVVFVGLITSSISVSSTLPVNNLKELIELAKAKPDMINWSSWGIGSFSHLHLAWLESTTGAKFKHIPYKTIDQALTATLAGETQVFMNTPGLVQPHVKSGKLKTLAIAGPKRSPLLPDVPTLKEQGFNAEFVSWIGVTVPVGTPKEIIQKLNIEMNKSISDPKFVEKVLTPISVEAVGGTPEEFGSFMKLDREVATKLAKIAKINAN
jgi:tripartite-type tricarboxylate transporter receptor subunit TctC